MKNCSRSFKESAWHWLLLPSLPDKNCQSKLLFGCVYRKGSSSSDNNDKLFNILQECSKLTDLVTICGDFNFRTIDWNLHCSKNKTETQFLDVLDDLYLQQHVSEFTRKRGTDSPSLLDLIISDQSQIINKHHISDPLGNSDHAILSWYSTFKCSQISPKDVPPKPNYHKGNYKRMRTSLQNTNWNEMFNGCEDVDTMVSKFEEVIQNHVKEYVPLKKPNKNGHKKQAPWIDFKLLRAIKRKYHAWKRFQLTKQHSQYLDYIKERRKTSKKIKNAKRMFEMKLAKECKSNPKAFFSYANSKKRASTNFIRLEKPLSDEYTTTDNETAEILNSFFSSVFTKDVNMPYPEDQQEVPNRTPMWDIDISIDEVCNLLMKLDPFKSPGDDGLHPKLLKECCNQLALPILMIFKQSLLMGKFPSSWKSATVTPIYKSGERSKPENYRPISITSQVGKIMEKIIRTNVMSYWLTTPSYLPINMDSMRDVPV